MKRSDALAGLSRDHHQALSVALRLRRATPDTAADALAGFEEYFARTGDRHFDVEEAVLLPALPETGEWARLTTRVRDEHRALRARGAGVLATGGETDVSQVRELGEALHAHVRFEERELLPVLEQSLGAGEVIGLGRRLADDPG